MTTTDDQLNPDPEAEPRPDAAGGPIDPGRDEGAVDPNAVFDDPVWGYRWR